MVKRRKVKIVDNSTEDIDEILDMMAREKRSDSYQRRVDEACVIDNVKFKDSPTDKKRTELLKVTGDGGIDQSVKYIKKPRARSSTKYIKEHEDTRLRIANMFITDLVISKFSSLLRGLDMIESVEELKGELLKDKILKNDVERVLSCTPYIPCLSILCGGITVGKHVFEDAIAKGPVES